MLIVGNVLCNMKRSLCFYEFLTQWLSDDILNPIFGHANLMQSFDLKDHTPFKDTRISTGK